MVRHGHEIFAIYSFLRFIPIYIYDIHNSTPLCDDDKKTLINQIQNQLVPYIG